MSASGQYGADGDSGDLGDDGARYLRQRMLTEVGEPGQARLRAAVLRLVGGSPAAQRHAADYLSRAGALVAPSQLGDEGGLPLAAQGGLPLAAQGGLPLAAQGGLPLAAQGGLPLPDAAPRVARTAADAIDVPVFGPLAAPAALAPAADLLTGALAAVEAVKRVLDVGQPATLPADLFLLGDC